MNIGHSTLTTHLQKQAQELKEVNEYPISSFHLICINQYLYVLEKLLSLWHLCFLSPRFPSEESVI
ncbi:hypothetical protein GLYMA_02G010400v4 [Glycine max]|uniref:Uncharacterized protein n=1 Tax=Glycine max TaxID=3847 RepID=K7K5V7_SOYBN|nr:hypothetical protein JHK85_003021 [Glycine max]KAG5078803.1 hypothetical protein JHK86_002868 [Glycine max]KAH1058199.1 hypothetical protein GYH30_002656 [Glycine max]KRH69190.1 hypothetical protein GLYMA_02G010400v4 [Glycine max]